MRHAAGESSETAASVFLKTISCAVRIDVLRNNGDFNHYGATVKHRLLKYPVLFSLW